MTAQTARGRPLRFLGTVAAGWIGLRVVMLWPHIETASDVLRAIVPVTPAVARDAPLPVVAVRTAALAQETSAPVVRPIGLHVDRGTPALRSQSVSFGLALPAKPLSVGSEPPILPGIPRILPQPTPSRPSARWSGSFWLVARGGGSGIAPGVVGGQLGGSQAGVRLAYLLDRRHRIALAARVTTPLGPGLREAAIGVEWQPTRLPVRIVAEERIALGGGTGGPALGVVGGIGPVAIPLAFRLESYGQAGVIRRTATEAYADGAVRIAHTLARIGTVRVDLGAGAWGAAQRGAARVDVGPSLGVALPLASQAVRLSFDWRQRVAGDARPGSGPALTLGSDF